MVGSGGGRVDEFKKYKGCLGSSVDIAVRGGCFTRFYHTKSSMYVDVCYMMIQGKRLRQEAFPTADTEIDWVAYMQEVEGYEQGETDYTKLRGDTGPLVYPAGFVHIFLWLKNVTGGEIFPAQIIFGILYLLTQLVVMAIYIQSKSLPPLGLVLLCLSRRLHSIFVLRLFNDCWAMFFAYLGVFLLQCRRVPAAIFLFSVAVSIKMNVLLFAPGVLAVVLRISDVKETAKGVVAGVMFQIAVALPFLWHHPWSYATKAFEFSRVFMYTWTVNWKFIPEEWFLSKQFSIFLLMVHLRLLWALVQYRWFVGTSLQSAVRKFFFIDVDDKDEGSLFVNKDAIASTVFMSNFVGILSARSLHYQFYSWYFHTIPFLLLRTSISFPLKLLLFCGIEIVWNIFPSTAISSGVLLMSHVSMMYSYWKYPAPYPLQVKAISKKPKKN